MAVTTDPLIVFAADRTHSSFQFAVRQAAMTHGDVPPRALRGGL